MDSCHCGHFCCNHGARSDATQPNSKITNNMQMYNYNSNTEFYNVGSHACDAIKSEPYTTVERSNQWDQNAAYNSSEGFQLPQDSFVDTSLPYSHTQLTDNHATSFGLASYDGMQYATYSTTPDLDEYQAIAQIPASKNSSEVFLSTEDFSGSSKSSCQGLRSVTQRRSEGKASHPYTRSDRMQYWKTPFENTVREQLKREANNERERKRVQGLNDAFRELKQLCQKTGRTPKTKVGVLKEAADLISSLQRQLQDTDDSEPETPEDLKEVFSETDSLYEKENLL